MNDSSTKNPALSLFASRLHPAVGSLLLLACFAALLCGCGYSRSGSTNSNIAAAALVAGEPIPDDFNESALDNEIWTVEAPVGGSASVKDGHLIINVPGGMNHDPYVPSLEAVRVVQSVQNKDFDVAIKIDSTMDPSKVYSNVGLLLEQDEKNYILYELYNDGTNVGLYLATITDGQPNVPGITSPFDGYSVPTYLRFARSGTTFTAYWSSDATNWNQFAQFDDSLTVKKMGPYAGNYSVNLGDAPQITASFDYFHDLSALLVPPIH